jgi:hypothetical protein
MLSVMCKAHILSVDMLNVIMLNGFMLSVMAPCTSRDQGGNSQNLLNLLLK